MNTIVETKSEKTLLRIEELKADLNSHYDSISRLKQSAKEYPVSKRFDYAPRIVKYSCIPRSENRYYFTLGNIQKQIELLEHELKTLLEFGE